MISSVKLSPSTFPSIPSRSSARQDYQHAVEALERLKSGGKPKASPKPEGKKPPEKKEREKGGFLKSIFGGKK